MTFDPVKGYMTYAGSVIDYCDQVSLKSVNQLEGTPGYLVDRRKKELDIAAVTDGVPCRL